MLVNSPRTRQYIEGLKIDKSAVRGKTELRRRYGEEKGEEKLEEEARWKVDRNRRERER